MTPLCLLLAAAEVLGIVPLESVLRLADGPAEAPLLVRNLGVTELHGVQVEASAEGCQIEVLPARLDRLRPADRVEVVLKVRRTPATPPRRLPLEVRARAEGQSALAAFRLVVDARPRAAQPGDGWVDVGAVQIGAQRSSTRTWIIAGVCLLSLGGLLGWGLWLKRRAQARPDPI
ncbi:MAG TPA: hypothetical protein PK668_12295 [Myxococcota bacterium]|nr:hypothetical protein [Myxococcota bacterium]HRY93751.1 hypothetical protein [Myxococcota bacterium]HSA22229.1 hypothetical protein [Myxococcota bacterium]